MFFFYNRRSVETSVGLQRLGIEGSSRAAIQATPVRRFPLRKRATKIVVPATEKFCHQSYFLPEDNRVYLFYRFPVSLNQTLKFAE